MQIIKKESIFIGEDLLSKIDQLFDFSRFSTVAILTDENIPNLLVKKIEKSLNIKLTKIIIPAGENKKNIETVKKIWEIMINIGFDRQSLLINLGGGVIGDMGGFAASTFMRGIDFLNIPTTLLAQVDASVGGKTGINLNNVKNAIGIFKDPIGVIIDVETLKTLPKRELLSAFGEIIKHSIISGREYLELISSKKPDNFSQKELIKIIEKSVKIKSNIIKKDPKEKNIRRVLNFGHTIGHAIESLSWKTDKPLLHGEAVAIGMIAEAKLASLLGMLSKKDLKLITETIINSGLSISIKDINVADIRKIILSDKKNDRGIINWTLPKAIGEVSVNINVREQLVTEAINFINK